MARLRFRFVLPRSRSRMGRSDVLKSLTAEETDIPRPLFSPDGRYVAYSRVVDTTSKQKDVFLIPLDGGPEIPLVESPADDDVFGWLPAGQNFLYRSDRDRAYRWDDEIWMIRVVDGKPQGTPRLVRTGLPCAEAKHCLGPVQTPTRGWAFYYSDYSKAQKGTHPDVYIADFDLEEGRIAGEPRPASERFRGDTCRTPGWSPDGQYLAYYHRLKERCSWPRNPAFLVIRSMQTGHERAIELGENRHSSRPRWCGPRMDARSCFRPSLGVSVRCFGSTWKAASSRPSDRLRTTSHLEVNKYRSVGPPTGKRFMRVATATNKERDTATARS